LRSQVCIGRRELIDDHVCGSRPLKCRSQSLVRQASRPVPGGDLPDQRRKVQACTLEVDRVQIAFSRHHRLELTADS